MSYNIYLSSITCIKEGGEASFVPGRLQCCEGLRPVPKPGALDCDGCALVCGQ